MKAALASANAEYQAPTPAKPWAFMLVATCAGMAPPTLFASERVAFTAAVTAATRASRAASAAALRLLIGNGTDVESVAWWRCWYQFAANCDTAMLSCVMAWLTLVWAAVFNVLLYESYDTAPVRNCNELTNPLPVPST